jgi:NAD(P)H-nitrite reductase large subunit
VKYLIIGNCIAAVGAVEGIRRVDKEGPITILSKEPYPAYGRPLIAEYLKGKRSKDDLRLRPPEFYDLNGVQIHLAASALQIIEDKKAVQAEDRKTYSYDRLLLSTGGNPIRPPISGDQGPGLYNFQTIDDADRIAEASRKNREWVVIGGGLIGLKAAESLHDRGMKVTIVELADRVLSMTFDNVASRIISRRLDEIGIRIMTENTAEEILRDSRSWIKGVRLRDGQVISCGGVVVAIGVAPAKELAEGTPIKTGRGVFVDEFMETSVSGIFAAGDVAEAKDWHFSSWRVVPIWPNAYRQGQVAGKNMAGQRVPFSGSIPMNSVSFYGIPTVSMGVTLPPEENGYEIMMEKVEDKGIYRKLILKDRCLVGAVFVGKIERAGVLTGLIRDKVPVEGFKDRLFKEGLSLLDLPVELRKEKLKLRHDLPLQEEDRPFIEG